MIPRQASQRCFDLHSLIARDDEYFFQMCFSFYLSSFENFFSFRQFSLENIFTGLVSF